MTSAIGLRYARALSEVVLAPGSGLSPDQAVAQLSSFASILRESKPLLHALQSPAVQNSRKRAILADIGGQMGLARVIQNFIFVAVNHRRVSILSEIAESLQQVFDEHFGFARAEISTARPLDDSQSAALVAQLSRLTGKQIRPSYALDASLLGGATARIGSTVYDGSVRGQLENLRRGLAGGEASAAEI